MQVNLEENEVPSNISIKEIPQEQHNEGEAGISLHAITGGLPYQTLILQAKSKKVPLNILVDSGSSHNFLDPKAAKQIGCKLVPTKNLMITIVDDSQASNNAICSDFEWLIQGETFSTSMRILPLGNYQMILGVEWLKEIGHVTLDLNQLTLTMKMKGEWSLYNEG